MSEEKIYEIPVGYNEEAVKILEDLLEQAKKGEITSFISLAFTKGDGCFCAYTPSENLMKDIGAAQRIVHVLNNRLDGNAVDWEDP